jgi:hypothetical protein
MVMGEEEMMEEMKVTGSKVDSHSELEGNQQCSLSLQKFRS